MTDHDHRAPSSQTSHLWTPWRMQYVGGGNSAEEGCIFCNRLGADDDVDNLIVLRQERVFAILNLFPYNTGHLMIVPNQHLPSPEQAPPETLCDLMLLAQQSLKALRSSLRCDGFNIGLNVGLVAGAGVAEHMHQHVVPRWGGDANFMPILAGTMVMPELLPVTYAKVRAELARQHGAHLTCALICFDSSGRNVGVVASSGHTRLPVVEVSGEKTVWRLAADWLAARVTRPVLGCWAGSERADGGQVAGLGFVAGAPAREANELQFLPVAEVIDAIADSVAAAMISRCHGRLFPAL